MIGFIQALRDIIQEEQINAWNNALLRTNVVNLDEVRAKMDMPSLGCTMQEAADALVQVFGGKRESKYIDDGRGGIISVDSLTPIIQYGQSEPVAYVDDSTGQIYPVEQDKPRTAQYEDAIVGYEDC